MQLSSLTRPSHSNGRDDASKLKWDGVRCLFEDAQSDILLLLDTCAIRDAPAAGSHGIKQGIAACGPEGNPREAGGRSFTSNLIDCLHRLSTGRPFSIRRLFEEIYTQKQQELTYARHMNNGGSKSTHPMPQLPLLFTLTPGKGQSLTMAPLPVRLRTRRAHNERQILMCAIGISRRSRGPID